MTLEEKGPIVPPPVLGGHSQRVSEAVQGWRDVISATHWDLYRRDKPDGADFYVGAEELGHIHLDGSVHLATDVELANTLIKSGVAKRFPYGNGWALYHIQDETSADHALWLFELNYDRLHGTPHAALSQRIAEASLLPA